MVNEVADRRIRRLTSHGHFDPFRPSPIVIRRRIDLGLDVLPEILDGQRRLELVGVLARDVHLLEKLDG